MGGGRAKSIAHSLLQPRAVLVGIAVFNFSVFSVAALRIQGFMFCFGGSPWYLFVDFGYVPLMLLIACVSLYFGRWWSYLFALLACLPLFYWMVQLRGLNHWLIYMYAQPSFALQVFFATAIASMSLVGLAKTVVKK